MDFIKNSKNNMCNRINIAFHSLLLIEINTVIDLMGKYNLSWSYH